MNYITPKLGLPDHSKTLTAAGKLFACMVVLKTIAMKSTANIKGHPLHPILIPFPIAFFTGTLLFDVLGVWKDNKSFIQTAYYLEIGGIVSGLAAAIPGLIDYFFTVPPASSAKKRATKHGLINITMIVIFTSAFMYRQRDDASLTWILVLETAGIILLLMAGWIGGTLVYRNQIGVDPRYADSGKWNEKRFAPTQGRIEVATTGELKTDQMKLIHVNNKRIVLARTEQGLVAFDDRCSHKGGSLAGGTMICGTVQCPWHGSQFDTLSGNIKAGPAKEKIATYNVSEEAGKIYLVV